MPEHGLQGPLLYAHLGVQPISYEVEDSVSDALEDSFADALEESFYYAFLDPVTDELALEDAELDAVEVSIADALAHSDDDAVEVSIDDEIAYSDGNDLVAFQGVAGAEANASYLPDHALPVLVEAASH